MAKKYENQPYFDNNQMPAKKRSTSHQNLNNKKKGGGNFKVNRQFMQVYQDKNANKESKEDVRTKANGGKGSSGQSLDSKGFQKIRDVTADDIQNQAVQYEGGSLTDYGNSQRKVLTRPNTQQHTRANLKNQKVNASLQAPDSGTQHTSGNFAPVLAQHKYYNN